RSTPDPRDGLVGTFRTPGRGAIAEAIDRRRPAIQNDLDASPADPGDEIGAYLRKSHIRSVVAVPLMARGEVIGTLNLASRTPDLYGPRHLPLLQQIAAQLALAVRMTRLLGEEHRRSEQLR